MAIAFECPECRTAWPHYRTFSTCPECRVLCRSATASTVLTAQQAKHRLTNLAFLRFYRRREMNREGPTPEDIGRREAAEIIRLRNEGEDQ
jgi:hypothetical protein